MRDVAIDALFHQCGVIRAESLEELFDLAVAVERQPLPRGRRVGILTNAGGLGILCADACEAAGLSIPELSEPIKNQLKLFLPATASLTNPIDLIASATPEQYKQALQVLLASMELDALIVIHISVGLSNSEEYSRTIQHAVATSAGSGANLRPVMACLLSEQGTLKPAESDKCRVPCYTFPEAPARVLGKLAKYAEWRARPSGSTATFTDMDLEAARAVCRQASHQRGDSWLSAEETRQVLNAMRLPVLPGGVAKTPEEAQALARQLGFPVALKLASRQIIHKSEVGGVILNLQDEAHVRKAFDEISCRLAKEGRLDAMEGALVQPMISSGTEVIIGVTQDPVFGPLVVFGLGGIHVEILGDVCFRVTPLTVQDAGEMVESIHGARLLHGYRGRSASDTKAIEEMLLRVSEMAEAIPEIAEFELNPVIALPPGEGCRIVDARVRISPV